MRRSSLASLMAIALVASAAPLAHAAPGAQPGTPANRTMPAGGGVTAMADSPTILTSYVNSSRARLGLAPLASNPTVKAALTAHARYLDLNPDADPYTEEPGLPGYTAAGAELAPMVRFGVDTTWAAERAYWGSIPWDMDGAFLEPAAVSLDTAQSGSVKAWVVDFGDLPFGKPRVFPTGANIPERGWSAALADLLVASEYGCSGYTGYPVMARWDWALYDVPTTPATGTLQADGVAIPFCMAGAAQMVEGQAVLVPKATLKPGTHYTGTIRATFPRLDSPTQTSTGTQAFDFTTSAPATGTLGDQTGDSIGDEVTIDTSGNLRMHKMRANGTIAHSWTVGKGFSGWNWIGIVPDLNGDRRSDMLGRTSAGDMYLFRSQGMGQYQRVRVGGGHRATQLLTVVGDMDGNGTTEIAGRTATGDLYRWTLTNSGLGGAVRLGSGKAFTRLVPAGSLDGDARADIVGIISSGALMRYSSTTTGRMGTGRQVGSGWGGFDAVGSPGDVTGDARRDLLVRKPDGRAYVYRNTGTGFASMGVLAASGWGAQRVIA